MRKIGFALTFSIGTGLALMAVFTGCSNTHSTAPPAPEYYIRTNLTSDKAGYVDSAGAVSRTDPNLINPWGVAYSPTGPFWIAANGTGLALIYDSTGSAVAGSGVIIPPPAKSTAKSTPTGIAYNGSTSFTLAAGVPALYLIATQDGTISGWNPSISTTQATLEVDQSMAGAVYTGLAVGANGSSNTLFAANFHAGTVDIYDTNFKYVKSFTDPAVPAGYAPYGIVNINGRLVVSFALQDTAKRNAVPGAGNGYVDTFNTDGTLHQRLISGGHLNAPWGLAQAPSTFGKYSLRLLVANNGDGTINAYDIGSGSYAGQLLDSTSSNPITVPGLRALNFGNGASAGSSILFFTAGINSGQDGLTGAISYTTLH